MAEWGVLLNGVYLGCDGVAGCLDTTIVDGVLSGPPDGLGKPPLRTEDVAFPQRDGVKHFRDWYEPRIITLADLTVCLDDCFNCGPLGDGGTGFGEGGFGEDPFGGLGAPVRTSRAKVRAITRAWERQCDDVELAVFTDCHGTDPEAPSGSGSALVGPFGVVGRPRVADLAWDGPSGCATMTLRFDARDHRLFILDECGTPGSGEQCVTLLPTISENCRTYPRCYDPTWCYDVDVGQSGNEAVADNTGHICACGTLILNGRLTDPIIENVTTGEKIGYSGIVGENAPPVIIDTENGTATQGGVPRTNLLTGSPTFCLDEGPNTLRLQSFGAQDTGDVDFCWRNAVSQG